MKISNLLKSAFLVSILLTVTSAYLAYSLNLILGDLKSSQEKREQSMSIADEMRQSSDNLTNFARLYVLTEDTIYKTRFNSVLNIRDGIEVIPNEYGSMYWNFINGNSKTHNTSNNSRGVKKSIDERMIDLGFVDSEISLLEESKINSDELARIESTAFLTIESTSDWKLKRTARNSLFKQSYLTEKSKIMAPILDFYNHVNTRTEIEVSAMVDKSRTYMIYIVVSSIVTIISVVFLFIMVIKSNIKNMSLIVNINKKNTYLEHAAKILRHDMHSGINVYIPRGISSMERRLSNEQIKDLKIQSPLKMIKEGLAHTQKVYSGVYEFTNLVKQNSILNTEHKDLKKILSNYLKSTSYKSQVMLMDNLPVLNVNEPLFCTAIDNLIRNGLKYNDSPKKVIKVYFENDCIYVEDNGRGMSNDEFRHLSNPYTRKEDQAEDGSGLGLNICTSILEEHNFSISAEKLEIGTRIKITTLT
jgi:signal transduction histidine kinase